MTLSDRNALEYNAINDQDTYKASTIYSPNTFTMMTGKTLKGLILTDRVATYQLFNV